MTSSQETDRAYSNKKPQLPEPARGKSDFESQVNASCQQTTYTYIIHQAKQKCIISEVLNDKLSELKYIYIHTAHLNCWSFGLCFENDSIPKNNRHKS